jgi:uncharacterized protein
VPLVSSATADELARALAYSRFNLSAAEREELLADYLPYCTVISMLRRAPKVPACRDACDVPFLQLAVVGKADYLVSGDKDLLAIASRFSCPIITPADFLARL